MSRKERMEGLVITFRSNIYPELKENRRNDDWEGRRNRRKEEGWGGGGGGGGEYLDTCM